VDTASPLMIIDRRRDGARAKTSLRMLEPVECLSNLDCAASKPNCDIATGRCLPEKAVCKDDSYCIKSEPNKPVCDNGVCTSATKECSSDLECKKASRPICSENHCVQLNPRFVFHNLEHYDLPVLQMGLAKPQVFGGVVGAPLLTNFVVRLDYASTVPTLTFLDEIPDSNEELADDCDHDELLTGTTAVLAGCTAVMHTPLHGGGLATVGQYTEELDPTRLVVDVCLQPDVFDPKEADATLKPGEQEHGAQKPTGVAAQAVISTGLGYTVISRSVLDRLKSLESLKSLPAPQFDQDLFLSSGQEKVDTIVIDRAALVSNETRLLGPCSELALRRRRLLASKVGLTETDKDLIDDNRINGAGVALLGDPSANPALNRTITLVVVKEASGMIQGLRKELRSTAANVDMIIGGNLLNQLAMEVDYPKSRTILRCSNSTAGKKCLVTPFCAHPDNTNTNAIKCPEPKK